jgi:hypothetical protein
MKSVDQVQAAPVATGGSTFLVLNVWEERLPGRIEWRGEVVHIDSGATIKFEDWPELVDTVQATLPVRSRPNNKREGKGA